MSYLNSITLVGFVGSDPEQRQAKGNGSKFTVLSVATQRSWKNADDEWSSKTEWHRIVVFRPVLAERVASTIKKGAHVLVEGSLVSSTYEQPNGKGKKSKTTKITSWSVRADVVRRLGRGEPELNAPAPAQAPESNEAASLGVSATDNAFAMALGGGVDWKANDRIAIRLAQGDYLLTRFGSTSQHNFRLSTGVVFRFGGK